MPKSPNFLCGLPAGHPVAGLSYPASHYLTLPTGTYSLATMACPVAAWTRPPVTLYRLLIMGPTGKKNPRLAMPFLDRVT